MRIAYVGLSTPLFYDYRNPASKAPSDLSSSPNPILDSPFGLFLLFDEIWFLCRSLCPENMRELPYVKFLDESKDLPRLEDVEFPDFGESIKANVPLYERYQKSCDSFFKFYWDLANKVGIYWDGGVDNHTHGLKIGEIRTSANTVNIENLFFDMEAVRRIGCKDVELITNTFSQSFLENPDNPVLQIKLAELLVIDNIPNYLSTSGPYHPCIEKARDNTFLEDFREWITLKSIPADEKEREEMKRQVEEEIQKIQDEIFIKYLNPNTQFKSLGKVVLGVGADTVVPGISAAAAFVKELEDFFNNKKRRWQGFIVSSRNF